MYFEIIRILTLMRKFRFSGKKTRAGDNLSVCVLNLLTEVSPQMTKFLKIFRMPRDLTLQARNQKIFRAGEVLWN